MPLPGKTIFQGNPPTADHQPDKVEAAKWAEYIEGLTTAAQYGNTVWFETKAALDTDLAHEAGTPAVVYGDGANNGVYLKSGASGAGSWARILTFLPGYQFVTATDAGAGTANAIAATAAPEVSYTDGAQIITMNIFETNTTAAVTVAFDGNSALDVKTASGSDPGVGALVAGMQVIGVIAASASEFRLLSDIASAAIQQAVESARDEAEAAAALFPDLLGDAFIQANPGGTTWEERTPAQVNAATSLTRADFVTNLTDISALSSDGDVIVAGGLAYEKSAGATTISDLNDWVPVDPIVPNHWAENTTPGTTDMRSAIQAMWDYSAANGVRVTSRSQTYGIGDSGSDINGRSYGLLLKDGLVFDPVPGTTFKVLDSQDIDLINTDRTSPLDRVTFSGEIILDGNEANQGGSPSNGFNFWAFDIAHLSLGILRSRDPASWGMRFEQCDRMDYVILDCDHSAESNSDGPHWIDTDNVTGGAVLSKSLGDDACAITAQNRDVTNYNIGPIIVSAPPGFAAGLRGLLMNLGDTALTMRTLSNMRISVQADDCDGSAVYMGAGSFQNIHLDIVASNCERALGVSPGKSGLATGTMKNCRFDIVAEDMDDELVEIIDTYAATDGIVDNVMNLRGRNPADGSVGLILRGDRWTGDIDIDYDPDGTKTSPSNGIDVYGSNNRLSVSCINADRNLYLRSTALDNTFYLGTLKDGATYDLEVSNAAATGNVFIGGEIDPSGAVRLLAGDERFVGVRGATKRVRVAMDMSIAGDGTFTWAHGLVDTPETVLALPFQPSIVNLIQESSRDSTNVVFYVTNASGSARTTGTYTFNVDVSL